jgi:hypothetical protein
MTHATTQIGEACWSAVVVPFSEREVDYANLVKATLASSYSAVTTDEHGNRTRHFASVTVDTGLARSQFASVRAVVDAHIADTTFMLFLSDRNRGNKTVQVLRMTKDSACGFVRIAPPPPVAAENKKKKNVPPPSTPGTARHDAAGSKGDDTALADVFALLCAAEMQASTKTEEKEEEPMGSIMARARTVLPIVTRRSGRRSRSQSPKPRGSFRVASRSRSPHRFAMKVEDRDAA